MHFHKILCFFSPPSGVLESLVGVKTAPMQPDVSNSNKEVQINPATPLSVFRLWSFAVHEKLFTFIPMLGVFRLNSIIIIQCISPWTNLPSFIVSSVVVRPDAEGARREGWELLGSPACVDPTSRKLNTCLFGLCVDGRVCWIGLGIWIWPPACAARASVCPTFFVLQAGSFGENWRTIYIPQNYAADFF